MVIYVSKTLGQSLINHGFQGLNRSSFVTAHILKSNLHSHTLSQNLQLVSIDKIPTTKSAHHFQVLEKNEKVRPLVLMFSWTLSKDRNVMKYANIYTDLGFDVLKIRTTPKDLLHPPTGSQVNARDVLTFLEANTSYNPLLVHGFSVGAYAFGEILVKVEREKPDHDSVKNRFVGQIWDSAVDVYGLSNALAKVLSTNQAIQALIKASIDLHLKMNYKHATVHYNSSSETIHQNGLKVPGLFVYSKADVVSPPEMNCRVFQKWERRGEPVYHKCFEESVHVSHFMKYPTEYKELIASFLELVGLTDSRKRSVARNL